MSKLIDLAAAADFALGGLTIHPSLREVANGGGSERLEPRVMQVLVALARQCGQVVSRDQLVALCWDGRAVSEDAIQRAIAKVRKLGQTTGAFDIATVPRVGYRLAERAPSQQTAGRHHAIAPTKRVSICVLPFVNIGGEIDQEYFSDGISDDIITDLSKVSALSVVARNRAFQFKSENVDITQLARRLNVSHVLEGSVRKAEGRVRITAQLVDGVAGDHIWAERYDRDLKDIFTLQDEISTAIVSALKVRLLPEEKQAIERRGTESVEAYDLYLLAKQAYQLGARERQLGDTVVRLCTAAVEIDPNYAEAWGMMAVGQFVAAYCYGGIDGCGLEAAERSLALNSNVAEALAVKALILVNAGRLEEGAQEMERALKQDPDHHLVNLFAVIVKFARGRIVEAIRHLEKAGTAIGFDVFSQFAMIQAHEILGDADAARCAAELAVSRAEKVLSQDRSNVRALLTSGYALTVLGDADRAKELSSRALLFDPENLLVRAIHAGVLARLGDQKGALDLLELFFAKAHRIALSAANSTALASVHDDPRFKVMVAEAQARLAIPKVTA